MQTFFYLIDLNNDGKIFSDELFVFFNKFYEEKQDQLSLTPLQANQIENNIIKRYDRNSTNNYLTLADFEDFISFVTIHISYYSLFNLFQIKYHFIFQLENHFIYFYFLKNY
jgi:hypothetical protein